MISIYASVALIGGILNSCFALFVYLKNKRGLQNRLFVFLCTAFAIWTYSYWIWLSFSYNEHIALFWSRMLNFGATLVPVFYLHWILSILNLHNKRKKLIISAYILTFIFVLFSFSPWYIKAVKPILFFPYWPQAGFLYTIYLISTYFTFSGYALYCLIKAFKTSYGFKRNQIKYLFIGSFLGFGGGAFNFFLMYGISIFPPIGMFLVPLNAISFAYAAIKYRLMDIRLVISKSILYFLLIGSVATAFTSITFFTGEILSNQTVISQLITTLVVSLIIIIGLDPLKRFLSNITDKIFYRGKIDYQGVLRKLSEITAREIDLTKLLIDLSQSIEKLLKYKGVDFLYKSNSSGIYRGIINNTEIITNQEEIVKYLENTKEIIITEELEVKMREKLGEEKKYLFSIVKRLRKMNIGLIAPIISESRIIAFLIVNKKLSDDVFSTQDLNLISVLIPQIANALEKAKLYNEVQEFNISLQEKVDKATEELKHANADLETRNKYLTALQKVSSTISRSLDFTEVVQFIADSIQTEIGFQGGVVNFIDEKNESIHIGAMTKNKAIDQAIKFLPKNPFDYKVSLTEKDNLAVRSISSGEIQKSAKIYDLFKPAIDQKMGGLIQQVLNIHSAVSVPIYSGNKIIGSINFFIKKQIDEIKDIDIEVMKSLADQAGLVIDNLKLYKQIKKKNVALKQANVHLKKLDEAKSEFLSIASHQLRTPLTGIKGYLSMILEGDFGKINLKQKKVVRDAFNASDRMSRLINVFLNVSRIESGHLKLDYADLDLVNLIQGCVKDLQNLAQERGLDLKFIKPQIEIPQLRADADKIKDVVLNLVDNAIKYTPKGKIEVSLSLKDKEEVLAQVKDTGMGLDQKGIDKLFNKFSRGEGISKINTTGSGLGLYIVRRIIEEHGGKVWVESDGLGKGSTFQFTLPIK